MEKLMLYHGYEHWHTINPGPNNVYFLFCFQVHQMASSPLAVRMCIIMWPGLILVDKVAAIS